MIVSQIAACAKNRAIGKQGDLPWNLPEDMKFFRETTKGHIIIMGRKTYDSFNGKTLPQRLHIVISRTPENIATSQNVLSCKNLEEALQLAESHLDKWPDEVFIIGGGEIYRQALPYTHKIYLTEIDHEVDGDTFFPPLDPAAFKLTESSPRTEPFPFSFNVYTRIK